MILLLFFSAGLSLPGQQYIAGYEVAKEGVLRSIPTEYIDNARNDLVIAYQHTSHGTHVSRGVFGLQDYKAGDEQLFGVSATNSEGKLYFQDYALQSYAPTGVSAKDLSVDETAFIQTTRNFLDASENADVNVIMWSWCDISGHSVSENYLPGMTNLILEYGPGGSMIGTGAGQRVLPVSFIFMTGHAKQNANTGTLQPKPQSELITSYCNTNGQFCLDYYSIDSHDMDDNYWEDVSDDGESSAYGGNFYEDWQNSHTLGVDFYENKETPGGIVAWGEHTYQHITSNRKAYAFWWILARIAGWDGSTGPVLVDKINLSSVGDVTTMKTGDSLQFSAEVLPSNASNRSVTWSVENGSGRGTINEDGLLTAVSAGSVSVMATAQDGSETYGGMQIQIEDPVYLVASVVVSAVGGVSEILTGENLQLLAEILPENASNKDISWSVSNQTGTAIITPAGLLTATSAGTIEVIAAAQDGSGVSDTLKVTVEDSVVITSIEVMLEEGGNRVPEGSVVKCLVEIEPESASNQGVTWTVKNISGTASISYDGYLTAISKGFVGVIATPCSCFGLADTLEVEITSPVSIEEMGKTEMEKILLYPNPGKGSFFLDASGVSIGMIEVVDPGGQVVKQVKQGILQGPVLIDLDGFPAGCYFLRLHLESGMVYQKLIIY